MSLCHPQQPTDCIVWVLQTIWGSDVYPKRPTNSSSWGRIHSTVDNLPGLYAVPISGCMFNIHLLYLVRKVVDLRFLLYRLSAATRTAPSFLGGWKSGRISKKPQGLSIVMNTHGSWSWWISFPGSAEEESSRSPSLVFQNLIKSGFAADRDLRSLRHFPHDSCGRAPGTRSRSSCCYRWWGWPALAFQENAGHTIIAGPLTLKSTSSGNVAPVSAAKLH